MIDYQISEATVADTTAICQLINNAYRGEESRKGWTTEAEFIDGLRIDEPGLEQYFQESDSTILKVTDQDGAILGCVYLKKEHDAFYLGMLSVSPLLQSKGIGKLLLQAAEKKSRLAGAKKIVMTVLSARTELLNWYERHGFLKTGEKQSFPADEKFGKPKMPVEFLVLEKCF